MDFYSHAQQIEWTAAAVRFASWERRGIVHGFIGKYGRTPQLYHAKQVHGTQIKTPSGRMGGAEDQLQIEADALFCRKSGQTVAVKTADCLPILLYSPQGVMALHAGWRGLAAGIVNRALHYFERKGVRAGQLEVGLGPCISQGRFEVGPEVVDAFLESRAGRGVRALLAHGVTKGCRDRWHLDLAICAIGDLLSGGVKAERIVVMRSCTFDDPRWHSYRLDGKECGRNWSYITVGE